MTEKQRGYLHQSRCVAEEAQQILEGWEALNMPPPSDVMEYVNGRIREAQSLLELASVIEKFIKMRGIRFPLN
jgi:hypothetical protein